jgi:hypothetical protein
MNQRAKEKQLPTGHCSGIKNRRKHELHINENCSDLKIQREHRKGIMKIQKDFSIELNKIRTTTEVTTLPHSFDWK